MTRVKQTANGRIGKLVARHTDYAVPMNEVRFGYGTAMLKDSEISEMERLSVPGTELQPGDYLVAHNDYVAKIEQGQLPEGARYADITTASGMVKRCWEGFLTRVER